MDQFKSIWDSLGFKSNLAGMLASVIMIALAKPVADAGITADQIAVVITAVITAVTSVLGMVGRLTATTQLTSNKKTASVLNAKAVAPAVKVLPG